MATVYMPSFADTIIKIEDSPEPTLPPASPDATIVADNSPNDTSSTQSPTTVIIDPKDPEGFLRRCSGYNKKTRVRCGQPIGKNSAAKNQHPTFLPTCTNHRDQQSFAGWCQLVENGERCGRLFRWTPPYLELCDQHQGHPDTPCYFLKLPLELRREIFSYLLPTEPVGSSSASVHKTPLPTLPSRFINPPRAINQQGHMQASGPPPAQLNSFAASTRGVVTPHVRRLARAAVQQPAEPPRLFPVPLVDLLLVSHQVHAEIKDLLFSTAHFVIDIRKDGTFMCGRRLLEPRRADGSSHFSTDNAGVAAQRFISNFDFRLVKNYVVDISVENGEMGRAGHRFPTADDGWDEEVEIYDIRDYVSVAVTGILGQSQNLCKLNVRLGLSNFRWSEPELLENTKCLVGPFERLRNVRQPRFSGVYEAAQNAMNYMVPTYPFGSAPPPHGSPDTIPHCSVPQLSTRKILLGHGDAGFDSYKEQWERWLSQKSAVSLSSKPPIRAMFTEFKQFYTSLSAVVPDVTARVGKHAFLHRARVAREKEDVEGFRHLRNELIEYWYAYLDREEEKKNALNSKLSRMLDTDIYPSHESENTSRRNSSGPHPESPMLDVDKMVAEGIPMQGNQLNERDKKHRECIQRWQQKRSRLISQAGPSGTSTAQPRILAQSQAPDTQSLTNNQNMTLNSVRTQAPIRDGRYFGCSGYIPTYPPQNVGMPGIPPLQIMRPITIPDDQSSSDSERSASSSSGHSSSSSDDFSPIQPHVDVNTGCSMAKTLSMGPGTTKQGPPNQVPAYSSSGNSMRVYRDAERDPSSLQDFRAQHPQANSSNIAGGKMAVDGGFVSGTAPVSDQFALSSNTNGITAHATASAFSSAHYEQLKRASDRDEEVDMARTNPNFWAKPGHHPYILEMPTAAALKRPYPQDDTPLSQSKRMRVGDLAASSTNGQQNGGAWNGIGKGKGKARADDEVVWLD